MQEKLMETFTILNTSTLWKEWLNSDDRQYHQYKQLHPNTNRWKQKRQQLMLIKIHALAWNMHKNVT